MTQGILPSLHPDKVTLILANKPQTLPNPLSDTSCAKNCSSTFAFKGDKMTRGVMPLLCLDKITMFLTNYQSQQKPPDPPGCAFTNSEGVTLSSAMVSSISHDFSPKSSVRKPAASTASNSAYNKASNSAGHFVRNSVSNFSRN